MNRFFVPSVAGAGTFDGVFVAGILAVLIAGFPLGVPRRAPHGEETGRDEARGR